MAHATDQHCENCDHVGPVPTAIAPRQAGEGNGNFSHGHAMAMGTPTYRTWSSMVQRCTNPKRRGYENYGGRGISVCDRWREFENFLADMGVRPEGKTLDRYPNNDGNYEPGNCRWATRSEQAANSRRPMRTPAPRKDLAGERFGRLTVQRFLRMNSRRHSVWSCLCDCGTSVEVAGTQLSGGLTKSCGCLVREIASRPRSNATRARMSAAMRASRQRRKGAA